MPVTLSAWRYFPWAFCGGRTGKRVKFSPVKMCLSRDALKREFLALTGPVAAVAILLPLAVASIAFACAGADESLRILRVPALILLVLALSQFLVLVAFRSCRRLAALLLHLGFVLVLGGWAMNAWGLN